MQTISGKIWQRLLLAIFVVLAFSFWAATGQAWENDPDEQASQEVLARLQLSPATTAKVDALFAEYKGKIEERKNAIDEAEKKGWEAGRASATGKGSAADVEAALAKWENENKLYEATVRERDAKVKQALPPVSAAKFARGMKLVLERNAKKTAVFTAAYARMKKDVQAGKQISEAETQKRMDDDEKKLNALDTEYGKKLDAEVGRLIEQK